jgi:ribulose-phosphate 3-epimerase
MKAGIVLAPDEPAQSVLPLLDLIDFINVLTVIPGFGGQPFMTGMMPKVSELRALIAERPIDLAVDGGVNLSTVPIAAQAGANVFIAGTGIYSVGATRYAETIKNMRILADANRPTGV